MSEFRCPKCDGPTYPVKADLRACRNCTNIFNPSDSGVDEKVGQDHLDAVKKTAKKTKAAG
jgi:hypothetical protein